MKSDMTYVNPQSSGTIHSESGFQLVKIACPGELLWTSPGKWRPGNYQLI